MDTIIIDDGRTEEVGGTKKEKRVAMREGRRLVVENRDHGE